MSKENVEVVRQAYEALNRRDIAAWRDLTDAAFEFIDHNPPPDETGTFQGRDAVELYLAKWRAEFDDFRAHVEEFIPIGDRVACAVTWRGTGKGSSAAVEWRGADLFTVREGKIVRGESGFTSTESALEAAGLSE